jgi:DNA-binding ferritin-like protein (oxidative damage protectant)
MENNLNEFLSNLVVEYHKLQNFHWYIKGKDFLTVHEKLEELYDQINEAIDEVAELILMTNGSPLGSLKDFLATSSIKEAEATYINSNDVFPAVLEDFNLLLNNAKDVKEAAEKEGYDVVSAQMDDYINEFTKTIWMINQTLK